MTLSTAVAFAGHNKAMIDLRVVPLFSGMSEAGLVSLADRLSHRRFGDGETVLLAGDPPSAMHVIVQGAVRVGLGSSGRGVALGPPRIVGEMSVISGAPVSATVTAIGETETLAISAADLLELLDTEPSVSRYVASSVIDRLRHRTRAGGDRQGRK